MIDALEIIKSTQSPSTSKRMAAELLKELLLECLTIRELDDLTAIYSTKPSSNTFGYDAAAACKFVHRFNTYATTGRLKPMAERREINQEVKKMSNYPDWLEDRFGNDIPDWAEERWGDDDDDE